MIIGLLLKRGVSVPNPLKGLRCLSQCLIWSTADLFFPDQHSKNPWGLVERFFEDSCVIGPPVHAGRLKWEI